MFCFTGRTCFNLDILEQYTDHVDQLRREAVSNLTPGQLQKVTIVYLPVINSTPNTCPTRFRAKHHNECLVTLD